ncbi:hypothetical protein BJX63DRAFT_437751 [Aspergillus granulosus]|uniref:CFEM domain-containing protein n=1 Tax=Aspergillus granulosus TaxID=176169 RepID=A0ABR4GU35_9EURO
MRYILPVALFGATTVMAQSAEEFINNLVPECLRSCAVDGLEAASGCDISDTDCFCKSGGIFNDALSMSDLMDCSMNANCEMSELESITVDPTELYMQSEAICSGSNSSSSDDSFSSSDDSDDSSNSPSNSGDSGDDTADESTPVQDTGDEGDGARTLSGSSAILAAGAMMALAAF